MTTTRSGSAPRRFLLPLFLCLFAGDASGAAAPCELRFAEADPLRERMGLHPGVYRCGAPWIAPREGARPVAAARLDLAGDGDADLLVRFVDDAEAESIVAVARSGARAGAAQEIDSSPAVRGAFGAEARLAPPPAPVLLATRLDADGHPELVVALDDGAVAIASIVLAVVVVNSTAETVDFGGAQQIGDLPGPDGLVTLREAILAANNSAGADEIRFNIPTAGNDCHDGACWFTPSDAESGPLPPIALGGAITFDGYTQTTNRGDSNLDGPELVLDGTGLSAGSGLDFQAATNSAVVDFVVSGFPEHGILATDADGLAVSGCYLGTDPGGTTALGNGGSGVRLSGGTSGAAIGGPGTHGVSPLVANRNLISGNGYGIHLTGAGTSANLIQANRIGTDRTGAEAIGNTAGVRVDLNSDANEIGGDGAGEGNLVSGNVDGMQVVFTAGAGNLIEGNHVGLDATGAEALPNTTGIAMSGVSGATIGGAAAGKGNVISGNALYGIYVESANAVAILGNRIGTDSSGTAAVPNVIGVLISASTICDVGNGTAAGRNLISGNTVGVSVGGAAAAGNRIRGNWIGVDASGTAALGNASAGVSVGSGPDGTEIGGSAAGSGNYIAANDRAIHIADDGTTGTLVRGNRIGIAPVGGAALGNSVGIRIDEGAAGSTIGGSGLAANEVANSTGAGVAILGGATLGHRLTRNSLHDNGSLGIDLALDGVTPNDAGDGDDGPNDLQNFPVLSSATSVCGTGTTAVVGTVDTPSPELGLVELFASVAVDPSGNGEGQAFAGQATPAFNGSLNTVVPTQPAGSFITATYTSASGSTSELSNAVIVVATPIAPDRLDAEWAGAQIALAWSDHASDEAGFRIERRAGGGSFALLANVGANATTFNDPGPFAPGTTYYYRVRAEAPGCLSEWTNVASAMAPPATTAFCRQPVTHHFAAANPFAEAAGPGVFGITFREVDGDRAAIRYARLSSTGATVAGPVVVRDAETQAIGSMIAWSGDRWGMVWYERLHDRYGLFFETFDINGNLLTGPIPVAEPAGYPTVNQLLEPGFAWDGQGWGIAWPDIRNGFTEVRYAHIASDGYTKETADLLVNDNGSSAVGPRLAWNGTHHLIVWFDSRFGSSQIYARRLARDGTPAGASVAATTTAVIGFFLADLRWDGANELGITWNDRRDGDDATYFRRLDLTGAPLSPETRISDAVGVITWQAQIALRRLTTRWAVAVEDARPPEENEEIRLMFADLAGAKLGADVLVSTPLADDHADDPALAWDGTRMLVAWHEAVAADSLEIVAQVVDESGNPGANPRRNVTSGHVPGISATSGLSALELLPTGFAAVWDDFRSNLGGDIWLRRLGGDGVPLSGEIPIADAAMASASTHLSAAWSGEVLAILWQEGLISGTPMLSRFDGAGAKLGPDLALPMNASFNGGSDVLWTGEHFLVAFEKAGAPDAQEIHVAAFLPDGTLVSGPNRISNAAGRSMQPSLGGGGGARAVVWRDLRDGNGEIYAAALDRFGAPVGPEIRLTNDVADSIRPALSWNGSEFGLAWEDVPPGARVIRFRRLLADATPTGSEIQLSNDFGTRPGIATDGTGWAVAFGGFPVDDPDLGGLVLARVDAAGNEIDSDRLALQNNSINLAHNVAWDGTRWVVAAFDRIYFSGELSVKSSPCFLDSTPPACPTGLAATVGGRDVTLTWTPATDTDFVVERQYLLRDGREIAALSPGTSSWLDEFVDPGGYVYSVGAMNGGHLEAASCPTIPVTVPLFADGFESGNTNAWDAIVPP